MTISSSPSIGTATLQTRPTPPKGPPPTGTKSPAGGGSRSDEMKVALEKLKGTNPELAEKMEKIGVRMEALKKEGVSMEAAHETIEAEFGKPTDEERKQVDAALGRPTRRASAAPALSSADVSQMLSAQNQNADVLKFLQEREVQPASA